MAPERPDTPDSLADLLAEPPPDIHSDIRPASLVAALAAESAGSEGSAFNAAPNAAASAVPTPGLTVDAVLGPRGILSKDTAAAESLMPTPPDGVSRLEAASWAAASRVLLNLDEFITRE